jgi:hypothetical protein
MALQPKQIEAIQLAVSSGEPLPQGMASELFASFLEEKNAAEHLRLQKAGAEKSLQTLTWERDETLRIKNELEKEIEERVYRRTQEQREEIQQKNRELFEWSDRLAVADSTIRDLRKERENGIALIRRMRDLLADKLSEKWWAQLVWRRKAKRVLEHSAFVDNDAIRNGLSVTPSRWASWE